METIRALIGPDNGDATALQLCARAVLLFVFGVLCIRAAGRRTFSQYSPLDIIVAIVVGSNISRMMTGRTSFFPGAAATVTLVVLHRLIAIAALRWPGLGRLIKGQPSTLIRGGIVDHEALRHQLSRDDLMEGLRLQKVGNVAHVELATLEGGGKISAVENDKAGAHGG